VRVLADGQTHRQTQTDFIICPMLYAIAMGQIISERKLLLEMFKKWNIASVKATQNTNTEWEYDWECEARAWGCVCVCVRVCVRACRVRDWLCAALLTTTRCSSTTQNVDWATCSMIEYSAFLLTGHHHTTHPPATTNSSITFKFAFQHFHSLLTFNYQSIVVDVHRLDFHFLLSVLCVLLILSRLIRATISVFLLSCSTVILFGFILTCLNLINGDGDRLLAEPNLRFFGAMFCIAWDKTQWFLLFQRRDLCRPYTVF